MSKAFDFCIPTRGIKVPHTPDWLHEIKFDGYRLRVERNGDRVRLITRNRLWDARASEALANAKKLPPGSKRADAIKKAGQLRIAADMKCFLMPNMPHPAESVGRSGSKERKQDNAEDQHGETGTDRQQRQH